MTANDLEIRLLDESFNEELLAINRACPIEGAFTVFFDRSPDFFAWPRQAFEDHIHLGAFIEGRLVGYCMMGFSRSWMGSDWSRHGSISDARVLPAARGQGLLAKIIEAFADFLIPPPPFAAGVVMGGNIAAERYVAAWRWPFFPVLGTFPFDLITFPLLRRFRRIDEFQIRHPELRDASAVADLIRRAYSGRMLAPYVDEDILIGDWRAGEDSSLENWFLAERGGRLRGVAAFLDEGTTREIIVLKSNLKSLPLRAAFRAASLISPAVPAPPAPGTALRRLALRWPAAAEDDPGVLRALMIAALDQYHGSRYHLIQAGFSPEDPLRGALRGLWGLVSPCQMFLAAHEESGLELAGDEVPFIDLGRM